MKKWFAFLLALIMCLSLCACGGSVESKDTSTEDAEKATEEVEPTSVSETTYMKIEGICVDDSYTDKDGSPLKMVYLFYTLNAGESNLEIDSKYTEMTIGGVNTYESDHFSNAASVCKYTSGYYYSSYIEDVYVGTSIKVVATFKVPEGDLTAGKTITFADTQIPEIESIQMSTDDIQRFATPEEMAQAMDPEGYAAEMLARDDADEATVTAVKQSLNGYYWQFYVNYTSYEIEFWEPDNFEVRSGLGTSSTGTYSVKNGYIVCTYPDTGNTVEIPYEMVNGEMNLDVVAGFDVF